MSSDQVGNSSSWHKTQFCIFITTTILGDSWRWELGEDDAETISWTEFETLHKFGA